MVVRTPAGEAWALHERAVRAAGLQGRFELVANTKIGRTAHELAVVYQCPGKDVRCRPCHGYLNHSTRLIERSAQAIGEVAVVARDKVDE